VRGDVSDLADLDRLFATVKRQQGRLDVLFANAGVLAVAPLGLIPEEHFDKVFAINVKGLLFTVRKALPLFREEIGSPAGHWLLRSSGAGSLGFAAAPGMGR
jgi:NAD(P)-dependent dehydrogenase (short-subunit alcohol dehydrogenase family)